MYIYCVGGQLVVESWHRIMLSVYFRIMTKLSMLAVYKLSFQKLESKSHMKASLHIVSPSWCKVRHLSYTHPYRTLTIGMVGSKIDSQVIQ